MTVHANKSATGTLAYTIGAGSHTFQTDVSRAAGGEDLGPSPHALFDAALAACTALTVTLYARRHGWPLEDARVVVERDDRVDAEGVYRLSRQIELVGTLDAQQRERLMEIAERCPIHKLMRATIEITTRAV